MTPKNQDTRELLDAYFDNAYSDELQMINTERLKTQITDYIEKERAELREKTNAIFNSVDFEDNSDCIRVRDEVLALFDEEKN